MHLVNKKLLIISHTLHAKDEVNQIVGWGPTIMEVNFLAQFWEKVVHIGCFTQTFADPSMLPYTQKNIQFCAIPTFGGQTIKEKVNVFTQAPKIIKTIVRELKGVTHVQVRVPMGIGVYVLPLLKFYPRTFLLWVKYANNWQLVSNSWGYRFQKWILKKNLLRCPVTINGFWPNQATHLKSFANPCISSTQLEIGKSIEKDFSGTFKLVYIGRMETAKGVDLLLESLPNLPLEKIKQWVFMGDGPLRNELTLQFKAHGVDVKISGFVNQKQVHKELIDAHFLVLPSRSEGFPKVVAEAWNYGCIPIVSPVGSIPHYVEHRKNGFLMQEISAKALSITLSEAISVDSAELKNISLQGNSIIQQFTYEHYLYSLKEKVFHGS